MDSDGAAFLATGIIPLSMVVGQAAGLPQAPRAGYLAVAITARVTIRPVTPSR